LCPRLCTRAGTLSANGAVPSLAFFFVTAVFAALTISPILLIHRTVLTRVPTAVWWLVLATGMAQMVYFFGLAGAYRRGDISLAYPLARALPVLLVAVISLRWGNGGQIGPLGLLGMALITIGCIILPLRHWQQFSLHAYRDAVVLMAVVRRHRHHPATPSSTTRRCASCAAALPLPNSQITLLFIALQTSSTACYAGSGHAALPYRARPAGANMAQSRPAAHSLVTGVGHHGHLRAGAGGDGLREQRELRGRVSQLSIPHWCPAGADVAAGTALPAKLLGIGIVSIGWCWVGIG
jgi:multidrug transporter EmrE-like cation transporter